MGKARQSRVSPLGLATWNNSSRLWTIGVDSSCLVPGPCAIWGRELEKEVAGFVDLDWLVSIAL